MRAICAEELLYDRKGRLVDQNRYRFEPLPGGGYFYTVRMWVAGAFRPFIAEAVSQSWAEYHIARFRADARLNPKRAHVYEEVSR